MRVVIDASVLVKWYVPEIHSLEAELLVDNRFEIHAPEIIIPEFGNILWKKCRLGELSVKESLTIADDMLKDNITLHAQSPLLKDSLNYANATGKTVHDWMYMTLALSLGAVFVTADRKFFLAVRGTSHKSDIVWVESISSLL
ncbi:MAG TPA: type II toxin-antitoxin system VapC family toxin [Pyrinomonadaceae bacterium]|nr:type II toxin-antitoxin system VapC family toxin [Pyrinomonadaceae bacterium]